MTTSLSQSFHGHTTGGEGSVPGDGGNLQSVYEGWGEFQKMPGYDQGYSTGAFPVGGIPSGSETQDFRISDSTAFNNLRGVAKTSFPFDPFPAQDHPNQKTSALSDNFTATDVSGLSSLLPGKYSYNNVQGSLSEHILKEFDAGTSTYNSLDTAESASGLTNNDGTRSSLGHKSNIGGMDQQIGEGIEPRSIQEEFREAYSDPTTQDVPLTPFHYTYPNFGTGKVDYGFQEPGADQASADIIRAYHAVLPAGQLAGTKKELMPVFSGVNQEAVEQRPILQSLGKQRNTLYLGGVVNLPDQLAIDPRQSLLSGSNIPTGVEQTAGELASALDTLGFYKGGQGADNANITTPYGLPLGPSQTLSGAGVAPQSGDSLYGFDRYTSGEPLVFGGSGYEYTSPHADTTN